MSSSQVGISAGMDFAINDASIKKIGEVVGRTLGDALENVNRKTTSFFDQYKKQLEDNKTTAASYLDFIVEQNKKEQDFLEKRLQFGNDLLNQYGTIEEAMKQLGDRGKEAINEYAATLENLSEKQKEQYKDFFKNAAGQKITLDEMISQVKNQVKANTDLEKSATTLKDVYKKFKSEISELRSQLSELPIIGRELRDLYNPENIEKGIFPTSRSELFFTGIARWAGSGIWSMLSDGFKKLMALQDEFITSTYRATGSINDHVMAMNKLGNINGLSIEINQKSYKAVIENGLQYGKNTKILIEFADTLSKVSRLTGVSSEELSKLSKNLTGLGSSAQQVKGFFSDLVYAQEKFGISSSKMQDIISKTTEKAASLAATFGTGAKALQDYASMLTVIEGMYGTQANYAPYVATGVRSITEEISKLNMGSMTTMLALQGQGIKATANLKELTYSAMRGMVDMVGADKIKEAFGTLNENATVSDLLARQTLQTAISAMGISQERGLALAKLLEDNNGNINSAIDAMRKEDLLLKERQESQKRIQDLEERYRKSLETTQTKLTEATTRFKTLFMEGIGKPIMSAFTFGLNALTKMIEYAPNFTKGLAIGLMIIAAQKIWYTIQQIRATFANVGTQVREISTSLKQAAASMQSVATNMERTASAAAQTASSTAQTASNLQRMPAGGGGGGGGMPMGGGGMGLKGMGLTMGLSIGGQLIGGAITSAGQSATEGMSEREALEERKGYDYGSSMVEGAATGAAMGAWLAPATLGLSVAAGAALGAIVGGVKTFLSRSAEEEALDAKEGAEKKERQKEINEALKKERDALKARSDLESKMLDLSKNTASVEELRLDALKREYNATEENTINKIAAGAVAGRELSDRAISITYGLDGLSPAVRDGPMVATRQTREWEEKLFWEDYNKQKDQEGNILSSITTKSQELVTQASSDAYAASVSSTAKINEKTADQQISLVKDAYEDIKEKNTVETLPITKLLETSNVVIASAKEEGNNIMLAVDKIILALKEFHEKDQKQSIAIKDILSKIDYNTESKGVSPLSVWR